MARPSTSSSNGRTRRPSVGQLGSPFSVSPLAIGASSGLVRPSGSSTAFTSATTFPSQLGPPAFAPPAASHRRGDPTMSSSPTYPAFSPGVPVPSSTYVHQQHQAGLTPRKGRPKKGSKAPKLTFVQALYQLLANPDVYFCARWDDEGGKHILIQDSEKLMTFVRKDPNFKMTMMPSFTRQLNIYGFLKRFTCAEAFPGYEPLPGKVLAIWTHEYLHRHSSASDIANVKRRVVEASRTDAEESPTSTFQMPQPYPISYSQPRPLAPQSYSQPQMGPASFPSQHRHGLSFEYEDAHQPIAATSAWSGGVKREPDTPLQEQPPSLRHQSSMQNLQRPIQQLYHADDRAPTSFESRLATASSSLYNLQSAPPAARQQAYPQYPVTAAYERGPPSHTLRHQASFTSESSATSSVYEMEGSSHSEVEMGYRTPPRMYEPIPVRLDYPLDPNLNPESHWGTLPHISPPLLNTLKGNNNSSATTPIPSISRPPGHHHPFRYTYNPMGGAGGAAGGTTYAPPSPPSMEQDVGLVYVDGSGGGSGGNGAEMQAAYGLGAGMGGR